MKLEVSMNNRYFNFFDAARLVRAFSLEYFDLSPFDHYSRSEETDTCFYEQLFGAVNIFISDVAISREKIARMLLKMPEIYQGLLSDAESIYISDPAATSVDEVVSCYPGFFAIMCHRLAHLIYLEGVKILPRIISEYAHSLTGIDIHPGATVGARFSIDHGTGVVIGQTAVIGDDVKIYQGVTIGARSFPRDEKGDFDRTKKRHPTLCDGCTVYANATILGGDTVVGRDSVIGANVWLTSSVEPGSIIYYGRNENE